MLVLTDSELSTMIASSESSLVPVPSQCAGAQNMTAGLCPEYPHSPSASKTAGQHMAHPGAPNNPMSPRGGHQNHQWDINDSTLPVTEVHDPFELWPSGHYRRVYRGDSDDARRHVSGWAMRNTNNHNALILKKSCLGVLVCSLDCLLDSGRKVHLRPAICDKARRKQIGKPCPNPGCQGKLTLLSCRGHCGYPVTHFWRHVNNSVFFQAKGYHDHPRPEVKSLSDKGRHAFSKQLRQDGERIFSMPTKRRFPVHNGDDEPDRKMYIPSGDEVMCSCPPFECVCPKSAQSKNTFMPSAFGFIRDSPSHTYLPHRSPPVPGMGMEQLTHGPFTQINITNTCLPAPGLEVNIPGIDIYKNCSKFVPHNYYHDNDMKIFRYGSGEVINNPLSHGQHVGRGPMDDLRSPQIASCPSSAGLQQGNPLPRNFSGSSATCNQANIYINDGRDDYSRYRINAGQCYNKGRGLPTGIDDRSQALGLSLKTEPSENVFRDIPSSPHGGQTRSYQSESMYNPVSPHFHSDSIVSPRTVECPVKYERPPEAVTKEQDHLEGSQELTYITLTSPPRQRESVQSHREFHSCRLGHMSRSPSTVESSLDNVIFASLPSQPTRVDSGDADPNSITELSPRHQDSREMAMTPTCSTPTRRPSPPLPRLVLGEDLLNQQNSHGRNNNIHPPFTPYHDTSSTPYSLPSDGHMPSYPPGGSGYGSGSVVPYGFYCNDMFANPSQQSYRNRSINITLTYN